jgi:hypothetical protein
MKKLLLATVLMAGAVIAAPWDDPTVRVSWTAPTIYEDGNPIDLTTISYRISDGVEQKCDTEALTCDIPLPWGQCMNLIGVSYDSATDLVSKESNTVEVCSGPRPLVAPSNPIITVEIVRG